MSELRTVFVADPSKVKLWAPLAFLAAAAALYLGLKLVRRGRELPVDRVRAWSVRVAVAAALVGALLAAMMTVAEYRLCSTPLDGRDVSIVTGRVTDFRPMPATGHAAEEFTVEGVRFSFSGIGESCSFNHAAAFGGPLKEGVLVRVYHKRGRILRLDVAE